MTSYMNVPTTQAAVGYGGNDLGDGEDGGGNDRKRHRDDEGESPAKRTRGGKTKSLDGRCLHCERDGHQWRFCLRRRHVASELGVGDGSECPIIRRENPQWYATLSHGLQHAARARAQHDEQFDPARGTWDERSYLQETIKGLTNEESTLLWRARLVGQARAETEARLAAFERRQTAVAPASHIQTPDRRLAPIFASIPKQRLGPTRRLAPSGPGADEPVDMLPPRNGSVGTSGAPPTGPRSGGSSLG
ncbi:hypothetical protein LTR17_022220 [Elasticomyces elasticus]|nr:hypothetical protein LTR17_022220 [Elasticomyces elasticus]